MTPKQKAFVDAYLVERNATKAAKKAGYSPKTAYSQGQRLLKDAEIASAVEKRAEKVAAKADLTFASHLAKLEELRDMALAAGQINAAIRAEELRGKVTGLYTERVEHSGTVTHEISEEQREAKVLALLTAAKKRKDRELVS